MLLPVKPLSFMPDTIRGTVSFITSLAGLFISFWAQMAFIIAVSNRYSNNEVTIKKCFINVKGKYWRFVGINMIYFLIFGAGLLLLLIPGIYWGTIFSLAPIAVVLEKKDIRPFGISRALIKGYFWKLFLLNLMLSILVLCPHSIHFAKLNYELSNLLAHIFATFCVSFSTVVMVILYHGLKERKESDQSLHKAMVPIKRGPIGCLGAIGLIILIILLTPFWAMGLREYLKTEKGTQVSEYVKKAMSPHIVVPGGATLERPKGWLVLKGRGSDPKLRYELIRSGHKRISLWSIPIKDLNVSKAVLTLDNQIIGNKISDQIEQSPLVGKSFKVYKPQPVKIITLGNRHWWEYDHVSVLGKTTYYVWKNVYTIYDDYILVVSRKYRLKYKDEDIKIQEDLLKEDKELQKIISAIKFP